MRRRAVDKQTGKVGWSNGESEAVKEFGTL
jgi:hypothetical protein